MARDFDDLTALDGAFELPDTITDPKLRGLYEVLVSRMRDEAKHLPMNTVQQLLIERIAYNYIVLRAKERGEFGGFGSTSVQKDFNTFWLSMTQEFNRMLGKGGEPMSATERKALLRDMQQIIVSTVSTVADPKTRGALLETFASNFEKAGI
jgi:hypothetical protein